jgi:hypothetical protein
MSVFREMFDRKYIDHPHEYRELLRMLSEAIERGFVEEIPNRWKGPGRFVRWFREKDTGVVYALEGPDDKSGGAWWELGPEDLFPDTIIAPIGRLPN